MNLEFAALALILIFPALGVLFNLFLGPRLGRGAVNLVGPGVMFLCFAVATWAFVTVMTLPAGSALFCPLWGWLGAGSFHVQLGLRVDALSGVMVMIVSGVGAFIHLYSVGYMAHDDYARYFTYLNLFALSMLILVLADNLVMMFVGWEGVGLCSYLLIGFWYTNQQFAYNGRKAFIVTRTGDAGFLLGIFTLLSVFAHHDIWSLNFTDMQAHAALIGTGAATAAGLLLFMGATGKSAQIPLYVWLPDAMVGPTPVSALIHAATMVTAGVYMIARLNFLYMLAPDAMTVVATIGGVTAFFAATIAIVQPDIKRVLAYSTISQLGYMFLGVGSGAFAAGIFHLMTHAFFKGLLFLCAGSVIHALEGEQDMNKMGALRTSVPTTFWTMLIATLAISAVPGFSGYFSKDLILEGAYESGHFWLWLLGAITAGITSFYMFRLIFMTFFGESRVEPDKLHHVHESPPIMTIPLVVLAVFATIGGWVGLPEGLLWGNAFAKFLSPVVGDFKPAVAASPAMLSAVATGLGGIGILLAYVCYLRLPGVPQLVAARLSGVYHLLLEKYRIDELYDLLVTRPLFFISDQQALPQLRLLDIETAEPWVLLGDKGKVTWIVFWSAGSSSGRASLRKLEGVWKRLRSHRRFTLVTAAANSDQPQRVREALAEAHTAVPAYLAGAETLRRFGAELADPPLHLLVDGNGQIAALVRGAGQDTINRLATQVQRWLEEIDPLGNTLFAGTAPAGLALPWIEPPG